MRATLTALFFCVLASVGFSQTTIPSLPGETEEQYFARILPKVTPPATGALTSFEVPPRSGTLDAQLMSFYQQVPSLINVLLSEKRLSGNGWNIPKEDRLAWAKAIQGCDAKRTELRRESQVAKEPHDLFWKKVFDTELDIEKEVADLLWTILPPDEQDRFLIEHSKDLGVSVLSSRSFLNVAKLDRRVEESIKQKKRKAFELTVKSIKGTEVKPYEGAAVMNSLMADFSPSQFKLVLVLQGRMDTSESIEEGLGRLSEPERDFAIRNIPSLKSLVLKN